MHVLLLIWMMIAPAWGAPPPLPADCVARPALPGASMPIEVQVPLGTGIGNGRRGAMTANQPTAANQPSAYVAMDVPVGGTVCQAAQPALPRDILHGGPVPGVLRGTPSHDLLRDSSASGDALNGGPPPRTGQVIIDVR